MSVEFDKEVNSARSMAVVSEEEKHLGMEHLIWWLLCLIESKVTVGFTRKLALPSARCSVYRRFREQGSLPLLLSPRQCHQTDPVLEYVVENCHWSLLHRSRQLTI